MEIRVLNDASRTLRLVGYAEGTSFLILLGIAMPLKYIAQIPDAVLVVGWAHGLLWVLYVLAALRAKIVCKWSMSTLFWAGVASVMPLGPFVFDWWLRRRHERTALANAET